MSETNEDKTVIVPTEDKKKDVTSKEKSKRSNEKRRSRFKESQELFTRASFARHF